MVELGKGEGQMAGEDRWIMRTGMDTHHTHPWILFLGES
jgi:hypothetical protein